MGLKEKWIGWKAKRARKNYLRDLHNKLCREDTISYDDLASLYDNIRNQYGERKNTLYLMATCNTSTIAYIVQNPHNDVDDFSFVAMMNDNYPDDMLPLMRVLNISCRTQSKRDKIIFVSMSMAYGRDMSHQLASVVDYTFSKEIGVETYLGITTENTKNMIGIIIRILHEAFDSIMVCLR